MPELADLLVTAKPLETSGARAANRTDYQKDWALCLLLRLHESASDYLLLLEHHDDIAVVDSSVQPRRIMFFQVKTAARPWTTTSLTRRRKGKAGPKPSILGKLFHNGKQFGASVEKLSLVSNARYSVKLADGRGGETLSNICFVQLSEEEKARARLSLKAELGVDVPLPWEGLAFLVVDDLSVTDHATHTRGRISAFLEGRGQSDSAVGAVYRVLFEEVRRRAHYEGTWSSPSELATCKGISRADFDAMLARANTVPAGRAWEQCAEQLAREHVSFTEIQRLRKSWTKHEVYRMNASDLGIRAFRDEVTERLLAHTEAGRNLSLTELAAAIASSVRKPPAYTADDIRAAIMLETYAARQVGELQEAAQKPEDAGT